MSTTSTPGAAARQFHCSYHPERRAQGVCIRCKKVICNECSTKLDGINHCRPCLERVTSTADRARQVKDRNILAFLGVLALLTVHFFILASWP